MKSMYLMNSVLNITVISPAPLVNSTLTYYKAVFREIRGEPSTVIILAPVLMLMSSTIIGYTIGRIVEKSKEVK
jgi:hypothetical protein